MSGGSASPNDPVGARGGREAAGPDRTSRSSEQPSRLSPPVLRAAWWALRAGRRARRSVRASGLDAAAELPRPPPLPPEAVRGVRAALRRRGHPCIERSLVLQAWHAAHGEPRDVIVGVTAPGAEFRAHAWLDGEEPCAEEQFVELTRRRAPNATDGAPREVEVEEHIS